MMRQVMKWAALVLSGTAVLAVGAYAYYWRGPLPQVPMLSSAIQRAALRVGDRDRTYLAYAAAQLSNAAPLVIVLHGSFMDGERDGAQMDRQRVRPVGCGGRWF